MLKFKFVDVNPNNNDDLERLYKLLKERPKTANISHKKMPTWEEHVKFVKSSPYLEWKFIEVEDVFKDDFGYGAKGFTAGVYYITKNSEIGIFIFKDHQREGIATKALRKIIKNKNIFYANIAPGNIASQELFKKLGFKHIQNTYRR